MNWWRSSFCVIMRNSEAPIILPMRRFFCSGKGRGIALVRVGMGKPIGCKASCFLWWFLHGVYLNAMCGSCSFLYNSPMCGGVAGPCWLFSGIEAELGRLQKRSDFWLLKDRLQVVVSDSDLVAEGEKQQPQGLIAEKPEDPGIPTNAFSQPVAATQCHKWRTYPQLFMVWL